MNCKPPEVIQNEESFGCRKSRLNAELNQMIRIAKKKNRKSRRYSDVRNSDSSARAQNGKLTHPTWRHRPSLWALYLFISTHPLIVCSQRSRPLFLNGFKFSTFMSFNNTYMWTLYDKTVCEMKEKCSAFTYWPDFATVVVTAPLPTLFWALPCCHGYK